MDLLWTNVSPPTNFISLRLSQEAFRHRHQGVGRPFGVPIDGAAIHQAWEPPELLVEIGRKSEKKKKTGEMKSIVGWFFSW